MALSGTFYGTTDNPYIKPKIQWHAVQDVAGNYSDITATLTYSRTNSYASGTKGWWTGNLTIGDQASPETTTYLEIYQDSNTVAITHTARVYHDNYGRRSVTVSATGDITNPSSSSLKNTQISATVELDTIPRATTIAAGKADIESALLIHLDRKNDSFTHSIGYRFGALEGYIDESGEPCEEEVKLSGSTPWFNLPAAFYTQIPDESTGEGVLYCKTYSGDTQIGQTQQTFFTAEASQAKCKPDMICAAADINPKTIALTGDPAILVKNHSVVHCEVTGIPKNGAGMDVATVNNVSVALDGEGHGQTDIPVTTGELTFRATDSRGFSVTKSLYPTWIEYVDLTCRASATRVDPGSRRAALTIEGKFFNDTFTAAHNTLSLCYSVDGGDYIPVETEPGETDYLVTVQIQGLDYQSSHKIQVVAEDKLIRLEVPVVIGKNTPVFDWGEHDFQFHVPVTGEFYGQFQGLYIRTLQLQGEKTFTVQSQWEEFNYDYESDMASQGIFLFGSAGSSTAMGLLTLHEDDAAGWTGDGEIGISTLDKGQFEVRLSAETYGGLVLLSAEPFEIIS